MAPIPVGDEFHRAWADLPRRERSRLRRLVRMGRPLESGDEAAVAVAYARLQRSRPWGRMFWFWFVPGLALSLGVANTIHPLVVGVVLALAAQAAYAHRNLARVEQINAGFLDG